MVGRPYPIYKPYTGSSKPKEEEKKKKNEEEDLDKEIARLEKLKLRAEKKSQMRSIKKETFELEHQGIIQATKRGGKAIGRVGKFAGMVGRELVQPVRQRGMRRTRTKRTARLRTTPISVRATQDISLTKAIAQNDWSGSGLMDREFFSSPEERDLLGTTINMDNLVGSDSQKLKKLI